MKIVSLVPSWTETLIEANIQVIGRTRYCVKPMGRVATIPIVGGTKDADWLSIEKLKPDFVLMDKEENTAKMAEECPLPIITTHVTSLNSLSHELFKVSQKLQSSSLLQFKIRLDKIMATPVPPWNWKKMPGVLQPISKPRPSKKICYIIWKDPWICMGSETFIFSLLQFLNAPIFAWDKTKYPKMTALPDDPDVFYYFSSEPFPFAEKINDIRGFHGAIVDGENFSWFGIRAIEFLEKTLGIVGRNQGSKNSP